MTTADSGEQTKGAVEAKVLIHAEGVIEQTGVTGTVPWWSFTKTALAVAVLRLFEEGLVELDEPVDGKPFTLAQLLRHEAGLPDYGSLQSYHDAVEARHRPWPVRTMLEAVDADRLVYEPGHDWSYSNVGYLYIAELIQKAFNRPIDDALRQLVFDPAELTSARVAMSPADLAAVSMGDAKDYDPGWVYHGLVVGTALDAADLLRKLLGGSLLRPASLSRMFECKPLPRFRSERYPDPAYGLGLMLDAAEPRQGPAGHSGSGPGSQIAVYGQHDRTCCVWTAASASFDPVITAKRGLEFGRF